jgi:hypothetical protein
MGTRRTEDGAVETDLQYITTSRYIVKLRGLEPGLLTCRYAPGEEPRDGSVEAKADLTTYLLPEPTQDLEGVTCVFGFPAESFKRAVEASLSLQKQPKMTKAKVTGGVMVLGSVGGLLPIRVPAERPYIATAHVGVSKKGPGGISRIVLVRACFPVWELILQLEYIPRFDLNEAVLSSMIQVAGVAVGVGAFRPACKGPYGRFEIVSG